jgi:hypothetical protein
MSVFRNFNPIRSGNVNAQAHPNVRTYPWVPNNKHVRSAGVRRNWMELIQPQERGRWWNSSSLSVGAQMGNLGQSGGCGRTDAAMMAVKGGK